MAAQHSPILSGYLYSVYLLGGGGWGEVYNRVSVKS